ncbi:hypothetical protein C8Q74DRAFT_1259399 [Fomes fomentarius]|nr:hypothetical protein C8Q74DRAFT_1259399 [Fomes fomentarius]
MQHSKTLQLVLLSASSSLCAPVVHTECAEAPSGRSTPAVENLRPPTLFPPREGFFFEACVPSTPVSQLYDALDLDEGNSELNSVRELDQESIVAEGISLTAPPTQGHVQPNFASSFDSRPRIIRRCSSHPSF